MIADTNNKKRILIVDDMKVVRILLRAIFENEADMEVVGEAENGEEAVDKALALQPDLITMDIRMPIMDGFEATKQIMKLYPVPILVISADINNDDLKVAFNALNAGALAVIEKPKMVTEYNLQAIGKDLLETVRNIVNIKVQKPALLPSKTKKKHMFSSIPPYHLVALGCSTGGPMALKMILSALPNNFPTPMLIVQHITVGFLSGLIAWLSDYTSLTLKIARVDEKFQPGTVYFAPDNHHLLVKRRATDYYAVLDDHDYDTHFKPSIDVLFDSIAEQSKGAAIGGLLTGMGKDGAKGLLAMREKKCSTFVQDKKSCVVYGMPYYALSHGGAEKIVPLEEIANYLIELVS